MELPSAHSAAHDHLHDQELRKSRPASRMRRPKINEDAAKRLQSQLKFATSGTVPQKLFRKYDKDKSGTLTAEEFKRLIRVELRIPHDKISDKDIDAFVLALDDDGAGSLSIEEIADFVERGTATFFSGPAPPSTADADPTAAADAPMSADSTKASSNKPTSAEVCSSSRRGSMHDKEVPAKHPLSRQCSFDAFHDVASKPCTAAGPSHSTDWDPWQFITASRLARPQAARSRGGSRRRLESAGGSRWKPAMLSSARSSRPASGTSRKLQASRPLSARPVTNAVDVVAARLSHQNGLHDVGPTLPALPRSVPGGIVSKTVGACGGGLVFATQPLAAHLGSPQLRKPTEAKRPATLRRQPLLKAPWVGAP